jgi:hypothetical protein
MKNLETVGRMADGKHFIDLMGVSQKILLFAKDFILPFEGGKKFAI